MMNLYVIGCGGIGGYLCQMLPMSIVSVSLDAIGKVKDANAVSNYLKEAGTVVLPSIVDSLTLVDGDVFEPKNAIRQGEGAGSKISHRLKGIIDSVPKKTYLQAMEVKGVASYINPTNMTSIIPLTPPINKTNDLVISKEIFYWNREHWDRFENTTVIFLGVDNLKTRYELSKYAERFDNVLVINGGNSKTSGHVTVFERVNGKALDPNLYEVYPEVAAGTDKRPDEIACGDVSPEHDQIAITNSMIANVMMAVFNRWVREGLTSDNGRRVNEVNIDFETFLMSPRHNKIK
jgi:hypothetical protein